MCSQTTGVTMYLEQLLQHDADVLAVATKFATATPNTQQVGLSDMARYGEDGVLVPYNSVNYPYKLVFK